MAFDIEQQCHDLLLGRQVREKGERLLDLRLALGKDRAQRRRPSAPL